MDLQSNQVRLNARAANKLDAIRQVGQTLLDAGFIEAGYVDSMLERERVANTYLGNGIAIPHGLPKARDLIKNTGIAVLQVPNGVTWNDGETVRLVVGIAAKSDEHLDILRRLTGVLGDEALVQKLAQTTDANDIIEALTGERPAPAKSALPDYAHAFEAVVPNKTGLHARPATTFVDLARKFHAEIRVRYGDNVANGKNMLELLQLGVNGGATIRVSAQGSDAAAALETLQAAVLAGLDDEPETVAAESAPMLGDHGWTPRAGIQALSGISAAPGLAIGRVRQHIQRTITVEDQPPSDPSSEATNLQNALDASQQELDALYNEVKARFGGAKAAIFRAHSEFLNDPVLVQETVAAVFDNHSAAWAWQRAINDRVAMLERLDDPVLAGRAVDLSDVGQRVLRHLTGVGNDAYFSSASPVILLADDLTPSDTAALDPDMILGFCTVRGGPTSHTAIIARSMGIPAVVAAGDSLLDIKDGTAAIIDGSNGVLYLNPSPSDEQAALAARSAMQQQHDIAMNLRFEPATTTDGHQVEIAANINRASDAAKALETGAEGVGLMRTEFLFLERTSIPSEDEQFAAYRDMLSAFKGKTVIIRTLDIGGDKEVPYLNLPKEDNSFLGIRGIRLCLQRPDLFIPQLRALYRAASYGNLKIMFPMIATLEDWQQAKSMADLVRNELNAPQVPLGIMIEVPSAVVLADMLAEEVDFFSIGTNDLTQYTLAMDRLHPVLAKQADGLHPAVLRMIDQTVKSASTHGKWVGVCGGIAGDPKGAAILTGLGVSELSVSVPSIAEVKAVIRARSHADLQALAQKAINSRTAAEVRAL